jgi:magnesium chelatase family protein
MRHDRTCDHTRIVDTLRQPLEDHVITIARAAGSLTCPANFTLIAAMNR